MWQSCASLRYSHPSYTLKNIVTNMESPFPAMLVLWLGRELCKGKYGMTGSSQAWTLDFGDKSKIPENASLFSISLLGEDIRLMYEMIPCYVTARRADYKRTAV
ncbi:hypothetical protein AVEN_65153-1 [Araneus ventricosus]|uniref:Uncharacterized protein n=1 Tax=Araneus ventricosus TaxID=182803 RepID=A0A4Y2AFQ1_ARAVE|nr:hypothetical protein AVEN_65153-1 [Araneus ventricosus]